MRYVREIALAVGAALLMTACAGPGGGSTASLAEVMKSSESLSLDENGYIRHWVILAPIGFGDNYIPEDIEKEQIANEAGLTPRVGDKLKVTSEEGEPGEYQTVQKELTWQRVDTEDYFFDVNAMLEMDYTDACGAYAVAYLDAPEEMKGITFSLCSNDNGKIYFNGKSIYSFVGGRSLYEDADVVEDLTLNKGVNVLVFKVWNDSNNWQGCLRLLNKEGSPVTNAKVRVPKK